MAKVFVKFPKVGLGNMMLVWARAVVFARMNNLPMVTSFWWGVRIGPFLRGEKQKRFYWGYFIESSVRQLLATYLYAFTANKIFEPALTELSTLQKTSRSLFVFTKFEVDKDLFGYIRNYSSLIRSELLKILNPDLKRIYGNIEPPVISIHIRRGDFKHGTTLTPNAYFIKTIQMIRKVTGKELPVTIFTDATTDEIKDIMQLPGTSLSNNKKDILDILSMSDSKIIILSGSSTFSYWGAFLSDAIVVRPLDWQKLIKKPEGNYVEFQWDGNSLDTALEIEKTVHKMMQR